MSTSLYETFGNEVSYEVRKDKLVKFLENSTIAFPIPEASVEILTTMLGQPNPGMNGDEIDLVYGRLTSIGFNEATGKTLAVALIQIAKQQGVHPMEYFEINETSIKLAENTYKAINKIRPKGNLIGLTVSKTNRQSKIANAIRP
jgi:hypothetical protein|tara:strand:- start:2511 stop:2945 length:435 start_codon:yes stop_codon:yes gene_type:complete